MLAEPPVAGDVLKLPSGRFVRVGSVEGARAVCTYCTERGEDSFRDAEPGVPLAIAFLMRHAAPVRSLLPV